MANSNVNFLQSASIIPFIPRLDMQFVGVGLMPDRDIYCFFDEVDVHQYIQTPNRIQVNNRVRYHDLLTGRREPITSGSNTASFVLLSSANAARTNTIIYVHDVRGKFVPGQTITSTGQPSGVILDYVHCSGRSWRDGTANTIYLANDSTVMANDFWGTDGSNTIFFTSGLGVRQWGNISGFNNVTTALTISGTLTTNANSSSRYTIGSPSGSHVVDDFGFVPGIFNVPSDGTQHFMSGDRVLKLIDSASNIETEAESSARKTFYGYGLQVVASQIGDPDEPSIITIINNPPEDNPPHWLPPRDGGGNNGPDNNSGRPDPLAQTFFVSYAQYPNGLFLTGVDLFFKEVDPDNIPVTVEIRPTVNGYPSSSRVILNSHVTLTPDQCNVSAIPSTTNNATATTFTFKMPIFLRPGEYALVVSTKSRNYRTYIAQLGQKVLGSETIVSEQPFIGSLFKSQNASTWEPFQEEDMMFVLRRARFVPSGTTLFKNRFDTQLGDSAAPVDLLFPYTRVITFKNTDATFTQSIDSGSSFESIRTNRYINPTNRFHITAANNYQIEVAMTTTDNAISPVISLSQFNLTAIQKLINDGNISNVNISITGGGSYTPSQNVALVFGSGAGNTSPATGFALANATGEIDTVLITNGGKRFTNDMTITPASGSATFNFVSETDSRGGPVQFKYISRIASLADGFDGGDLRLFITANKPSGTEIKCYYKIRNSQDPEPFDRKNYQEFAQVTPASKISIDEQDIIEYEFRPNLISDDVTYTDDNGVTYSTFHQYAIKLVGLSDNTTKNPTIYDMRCIALPGTA